ncbi:MAG: helix-turn-helix domain-containing protein [Acaryochloridaceae cyanobacterium RL_2_7]|nr:helix-turn-helix domain-containing protein [Acaryochloridaceae cyanobacterium RL_2_7]
MARLAPPSVILSESEQQELQKLVNRHQTPQQISKRAQIILLANQGLNHREIARELGISRDTARHWRHRWLESEGPLTPRLQDAPRSGAPATFTMEQTLRLYAMACEDPATYRLPISHWSARELATEMITQGIVETISARHVARLLEEAELKPHRSQYWLNGSKKRS